MGLLRTKFVADLLRRHFPLIGEFPDTLNTASEIENEALKLSHILFPKTVYSEGDKIIIKEEIVRSESLAADGQSEEDRQQRLRDLNTYLSSRTTLLGSKPSFADVVLYWRLASMSQKWSQEQRTGAQGLHNVVRYLDFVQNSTLIGFTLTQEEKVEVDPKKVLFVPKAPDSKHEKERKKKVQTAKLNDQDSGTGAISQTTKPITNDALDQDSKSRKPEAKHNLKTQGADTTQAKQSKKGKPGKRAEEPVKEKSLTPAQIDLRVGHILKAELHPNADSLFVSTIAVGDPPGTANTSEYEGQVVRTVCSGLNGLIPLEEMQNRKIVAVCNLKPVTMRGIKSAAMVLAASPRLAEGEVNDHKGPVELVMPPANASAGDRVHFDGWEGEPEAVLNPKKKVWDMCQVGFTTTEEREVAFDKTKVQQLGDNAGSSEPELSVLMVKNSGSCTVKTLKSATVR